MKHLHDTISAADIISSRCHRPHGLQDHHSQEQHHWLAILIRDEQAYESLCRNL